MEMTDEQRSRLLMMLGFNLMNAGAQPGNRLSRLGQAGMATMGGYSDMMNQAMKRKMEEKRMDLMEKHVQMVGRKMALEEKTNKLAEKYANKMAEFNTVPGDMFMPGRPPGGATTEGERQRGIGQLLTEYAMRMGSPGMAGIGMRTMYPEMYGQFSLPEGAPPPAAPEAAPEGPGIMSRISQMFAPSTPEPYVPRTTTLGRIMMPEPKLGSMQPQNIAPSGGAPMVVEALPPDWDVKTKKHREIWAKAYSPFISKELKKRLEDEGYL